MRTHKAVSANWSICFLLLFVVVELVDCNDTVTDHAIDAEIQTLTLQTSSPDLGSVSRQSQVSRNKSGVDADWQITTNSHVGEYLEAVQRRLNPDYRVVQQSASELSLRRLLPGDSYDLHLAGSVAHGGQTIITVHFSARPD